MSFCRRGSGAVLRVSLFRRGERLCIVTVRGGLGKLEEIDNGRIYVDVVGHYIQNRREKGRPMA